MGIEGIASHHRLNAIIFTKKTKEGKKLMVCVLVCLNQVILSSNIGEMISSSHMDFLRDTGLFFCNLGES